MEEAAWNTIKQLQIELLVSHSLGGKPVLQLLEMLMDSMLGKFFGWKGGPPVGKLQELVWGNGKSPGSTQAFYYNHKRGMMVPSLRHSPGICQWFQLQ